MGLLFGALKNPLCTRDALKTLILTIRVQDTRLLVGQRQPDLDGAQELSEAFDSLAEGKHAAEQSVLRFKHATGKFELVRLLYLLPYYMQQFLALAKDISSQD